MNSYEAYCLFLGLSRHFKTSYDYFKYHGKVNVKIETYEKRTDKFIFQKIAKHHDPEGLIVANLVENPKCWASECLTTEGQARYNERRKIKESLSYTFKNDLDKLDDDFDSNFSLDEDVYPKIIRLYLQKKITLETVIIIDKLTNFLNVINGKIQDDIIWPQIYQKLIKYKPFVRGDLDIYRNVAIQKFDTN